MSILLTEQEVTQLKDESYTADRYAECFHFDKFARAIQIALIEKMRKEPVGKFDCENDSAPVIWYQVFADQFGEPLYRLPTQQELEES